MLRVFSQKSLNFISRVRHLGETLRGDSDLCEGPFFYYPACGSWRKFLKFLEELPEAESGDLERFMVLPSILLSSLQSTNPLEYGHQDFSRTSEGPTSGSREMHHSQLEIAPSYPAHFFVKDKPVICFLL